MISGQWQLAGEGISGFAQDGENPRPLWVEVWADNELLGVTLANLEKPEGCGFWLPLGPAALDTAAQIRVCIANSGQELPQNTERVEEVDSGPALLGTLQVDRALFISGWALDPARSEEKLQLHAEVDDKRVVECIAGERRYRPAQADGHGFSLQLPERYADGQSHLVNICDEQQRPVPGCPFRICSLPQNLGQWLREHKKPDKPLLDLLADLLEKMEERLPGLVSESSYAIWKKAFPIPQAAARHKAALSIWGGASLKGLKGQQGVELKAGNDYLLLPGGESRLHANALGQMLFALKESDSSLIYADGETALGKPLFKPAFDREAFLAQDYLGPILARRDLVEASCLAPQDSELEARFKLVMTAASTGKIAHLPLPLAMDSGLADGHRQKGRERVISHWLQANYPDASYREGRIFYGLAEKPLISILIPTRDHGDLLKICLDSLRKLAWPNYEIIIIDNGTVEDAALQVLHEAESASNVCVLRRPGVFNYAALNNEAARLARGGLLCFLNNDTESVQPQWLAEMAALLLMAGPEAGAVGAKLLWPNGLVQHGGVIVGTHQLAAHVGNRWLADESGYMGRNLFAQQYSAVTAACLLTPKELFLASGGFDARHYPIAFNDVDYCLRIRAMGKKIFWTPHARLLHHESASRGTDAAGSAKARAEREGRFFRASWGHYDDPFYNPNLPLTAVTEPFLGLAFPPRPRDARVI